MILDVLLTGDHSYVQMDLEVDEGEQCFALLGANMQRQWDPTIWIEDVAQITNSTIGSWGVPVQHQILISGWLKV